MRSRTLFGLLLIIFNWLIFPKSVFAALTITNISPSSINSPEEIITISASASGLSNSTQYLQVGLTKEGESANYFGFIQNNSGQWTKYISSPDPSEFPNFFSFTPNSGAWYGDLKAKLDTTDSGFKGSGTYNLKLFKYITSSPSYSNIVNLTINITTPTPTLTPTQIPTPTPTSNPAPTKTPTPIRTPTPTPKLTTQPTTVSKSLPKSASSLLASIPSTPGSPSAIFTSSSTGLILGSQSSEGEDEPSQEVPPAQTISKSKGNTNLVMIITLITAGAILLTVSGWLVYRQRNKISQVEKILSGENS